MTGCVLLVLWFCPMFLVYFVFIHFFIYLKFERVACSGKMPVLPQGPKNKTHITQ